MATAATRTKSSASFAITIEAIRIGSKTTAVSNLAIDGGMPASLDFGFCFAGWAFKFSVKERRHLCRRLPGGYCKRFGILQSSESPASLLVSDDGFEQMHAAEIGPKRFGHVNLGVGALPQKKIRDAQLAAGAHQQVQLRQPVRVQSAGNLGLSQIVRRLSFQHQLLHRRAAGIYDLCAAAVGERDAQSHSRILRGALRGVGNVS